MKRKSTLKANKGNQGKPQQALKGGKGKGKDDDLPSSSDSDPDQEEIDKMEQLDLIKKALHETRRLLEEIDVNGSLYSEFHEIFNMFCGKLIDDFDDDESVNWSQMSGPSARVSINQNEVLEILAIPQFVNYFRVALDDENFFEATIERLSDLATV